MKRLLLVVLCAATLGGCYDRALGEAITLVNESSRPLRFQGDTLEPRGGVERYSVSECTDNQPLSLLTEGGEEYARLAVEYCPGQRWTITGRGEIVLTDG